MLLAFLSSFSKPCSSCFLNINLLSKNKRNPQNQPSSVFLSKANTVHLGRCKQRRHAESFLSTYLKGRFAVQHFWRWCKPTPTPYLTKKPDFRGKETPMVRQTEREMQFPCWLCGVHRIVEVLNRTNSFGLEYVCLDETKHSLSESYEASTKQREILSHLLCNIMIKLMSRASTHLQELKNWNSHCLLVTNEATGGVCTRRQPDLCLDQH